MCSRFFLWMVSCSYLCRFLYMHVISYMPSVRERLQFGPCMASHAYHDDDRERMRSRKKQCLRRPLVDMKSEGHRLWSWERGSEKRSANVYATATSSPLSSLFIVGFFFRRGGVSSWANFDSWTRWDLCCNNSSSSSKRCVFSCVVAPKSLFSLCRDCQWQCVN